jgi:salicylate hydroxylase
MVFLKPLSVVVVGGGIGGLSAALCMASSGHHVTVLESALIFDEVEVGAGVRLTPNCARLLLRWGLGDKIRQLGLQPEVVQLFRCRFRPHGSYTTGHIGSPIL